ncbi:hypothetical protein BJ508DRAFT_382213 [Ascobolus immersus RN42]|uniref:Uncharacterized protein n=1 Tax=Ascobolus immersus RN42 TaxID=1160509 RepID=A0A3N4HCX5_ASCIM|nr:hypothetical protein BJ508DRAFT_382213 [Ascobolus immersus RN42]
MSESSDDESEEEDEEEEDDDNDPKSIPLPLGYSYPFGWRKKLPHPEPGELLADYTSRNADLLLHFLADYYLVERQCWDPRELGRVKILGFPKIRRRIMEHLGLEDNELGMKQIDRLFGLNDDSTKNQLSATNLVPQMLLCELAISRRNRDPLVARLFQAAFYFSPELYDGLGTVVRMRPKVEWITYPYKPEIPKGMDLAKPKLPERLSQKKKFARMRKHERELNEVRRKFESSALQEIFNLMEKDEEEERMKGL